MILRWFIGLFMIGLLSPSGMWDWVLAAEPASQPYELEQIIDLTLERNPAMAGAEGFVEQHRGQQTAAGAYPNPTFQGNGGRGHIKDAGVLTPDIPPSATEYIFGLGQPLEWPAKRAARKRAAESALDSANAGLLETRLNLIADVKVAFYDLLLAQRDAELAAQNLGIVEDVRRIVKARVRLGEAPQFEAIKAEVEVLKANQASIRADNTVRVNRVVLDTLTAGALGPVYNIRGDFERFPRQIALPSLITRASEQHPTVTRLARLVDQAGHAVEFEKQARIPNVTVNSTYVREYGREAFDFGVSVPTPIWYRRQGEITSAFGAKRRGEADLFRARNLLVKEVNQYYQDAVTTANLIEVFEKGLMKEAAEALRIAQFSFQQGAASLLEVLDAQRVQRQILFDYAQARFDLAVALTRLERAVGGPL